MLARRPIDPQLVTRLAISDLSMLQKGDILQAMSDTITLYSAKETTSDGCIKHCPTRNVEHYQTCTVLLMLNQLHTPFNSKFRVVLFRMCCSLFGACSL